MTLSGTTRLAGQANTGCFMWAVCEAASRPPKIGHSWLANTPAPLLPDGGLLKSPGCPHPSPKSRVPVHLSFLSLRIALRNKGKFGQIVSY
jgi:hypothetical protein